VPGLDFDGRRALWATLLGGAQDVDPAALDDLAGKFRLSTHGIEDAARAAFGTARWRNPRDPVVEVDDLYGAARAQSMPILNALARKVAPNYGWNDIVLPPDTVEQLHEMCGMVEHRHLVYETWGFERKLALGKGVMALFAGQSGTGKTMAADVVAGALGLDLYKIDLSGVVSKYIGETEKNLGSIFSEAESSNAILFFDEADALFGKRSEVKDAHDRYANIETAYLLQRMEEYSGAVILATNLKMNLDEAFSRRLHFVIDFPFPEEDDRRRIWTSMLPSDLPRSDDIDFGFLARQFKMTGGNIRNIVLAGAFIAASEDVPMSMAHLIRATRREYQKLGRMVTAAEFGPYVGLLRG
jgi:SpoVK/Ycf46/Vps4 family AAA+-type ATPase